MTYTTMASLLASTIKAEIFRYSNNTILSEYDSISVEEPIEISIESAKYPKRKNISITMRTPGNDKALATGFLFTEGIVHTTASIKGIIAEDNKAIIQIADDADLDLEKITRHFYTSSSCGVCGKASIEAINTITEYEPTHHQLNVDADIIKSLPDQLRKHQEVFRQTGGLHAAALCDTQGNILTVKEDVGRHNALDKLIGHYFLADDLPLERSILLLSGRISFELVQKAIMAGVQFIVAVGAPSSLAIELAEEYDVTLVGFAKADRFNVYNGNHRIKTKK